MSLSDCNQKAIHPIMLLFFLSYVHHVFKQSNRQSNRPLTPTTTTSITLMQSPVIFVSLEMNHTVRCFLGYIVESDESANEKLQIRNITKSRDRYQYHVRSSIFYEEKTHRLEFEELKFSKCHSKSLLIVS